MFITHDNVWRTVMAVILFAVLFPFSMSNYGRKRWFGPTMLLHVICAILFTIDQIRRGSTEKGGDWKKKNSDIFLLQPHMLKCFPLLWLRTFWWIARSDCGYTAPVNAASFTRSCWTTITWLYFCTSPTKSERSWLDHRITFSLLVSRVCSTLVKMRNKREGGKKIVIILKQKSTSSSVRRISEPHWWSSTAWMDEPRR